MPKRQIRADFALAARDFAAEHYMEYGPYRTGSGTDSNERAKTMPDVNRGNRPLSPHLTIYRPQLTSMTSILTRLTGNALLLAALMIVWWFLAASIGPEYFAFADWLITSWFGDLVMTLSLWALWYHSLAGLRHLYWDTGRGLELETAETLGWAVIAGSFVLTLVTLFFV